MKFEGRKEFKTLEVKQKWLYNEILNSHMKMTALLQDIAGLPEIMKESDYEGFKERFYSISGLISNLETSLRQNPKLPVIKKNIDDRDKQIQEKAMAIKKASIGYQGVGVGVEW